MFKRIGLFLGVNLLIIVTISIIANILGVRYYITSQGIDFNSLLVLSALIGFTGAFISLALSRIMAKWIMKVRVINPNDPNLQYHERLLVDQVHQLSRKAGLTVMPEVGIYDSPEVNAFATGPTKNRSLVAVSRGLLERMDEEAVIGVLAHEVAHISNGDMVTMTLVQGIINTFVVFLSRTLAYVVSRFVKEDLAPIVNFIAIIVFDILFSILGSIAVMAYSRHREFHADAEGAYLAGKDRMIHALQSLQKTVQLVDTSQKSLSTLKINGKRGLAGLFSSHPDLNERIRRLQSGR
ncbi:protease HtpX [Microaerobacter geothermalis]|uniref:protease HtpX n=1 Tax=Microaerobacter geothermalis TaxID=674972 RepID=UPI001F295374|nr:protease HtpX [Microaerobacter geothermalis]MCF6092939.1 protease HtpX [Microaerobacter geothermalis]